MMKQKRRRTTILTVTLILLFSFALYGCGEEAKIIEDTNVFEEIKWAKRPMIVVNGITYMEYGVVEDDILKECTYVGKVKSYVELTEVPTEELTSNFEPIGGAYIFQHGEDIEVITNGHCIEFRVLGDNPTDE